MTHVASFPTNEDMIALELAAFIMELVVIVKQFRPTQCASEN